MPPSEPEHTPRAAARSAIRLLAGAGIAGWGRHGLQSEAGKQCDDVDYVTQLNKRGRLHGEGFLAHWVGISIILEPEHLREHLREAN